MTVMRTLRHRQAFVEGARTVLPLALGFLPFSLALGVTFAFSGLGSWATWSSGWLIFAGAAQAVAVSGLDAGDAPVVVIVSCLVVNSRHLLYGASLRPHVRTWSTRDRLLVAYFMTDAVHAIASSHLAERPLDSDQSKRRFYFGVAVVGWAAWLLGTGAGVVLADRLPSDLPIHLAAPLTFVLLLLPQLTSERARTTAAAAGVVATAAAGLPMGIGVLLGIVTGITTGGFVEEPSR